MPKFTLAQLLKNPELASPEEALDILKRNKAKLEELKIKSQTNPIYFQLTALNNALETSLQLQKEILRKIGELKK